MHVVFAARGACGGILELVLEADPNSISFEGKELLYQAILLLLARADQHELQLHPNFCDVKAQAPSPISCEENSQWHPALGRRCRDSSTRNPDIKA